MKEGLTYLRALPGDKSTALGTGEGHTALLSGPRDNLFAVSQEDVAQKLVGGGVAGGRGGRLLLTQAALQLVRAAAALLLLGRAHDCQGSAGSCPS